MGYNDDLIIEQIQRSVSKYIRFLYQMGRNQTRIAIELGVCDRTIRKWENNECVPSLVQYYKLKKLCKELGA